MVKNSLTRIAGISRHVHVPLSEQLGRMMMKKLLVATAIALATAMPAHAQSFNCNYAKTPDEVMICQSPKLSELDQKLATIYFDLINNLDLRTQRRLKAEQSLWLRRRMSCGYNGSCIEWAYRTRIDELEARFTG
jgi:uncharacterized protein